MSRPQEPHRPFFPFGNPFRMIIPKPVSNSRLVALLKAFEETLAERLRKVNPKDKDEILSLSWMRLAIESLCDIHNAIKTLITELELPVCDWDAKWIDVYLDNSVKLLDLCIAFTSGLSHLNQGHLLLQCALHNLESTSSTQFLRARSSLDGWRQHINCQNPKLESCCSIIDDLVGSLNLPKVKNTEKGKVLMRAMYGLKVSTVFFCSVFVAVFSGSARKLINLQIPDAKYLWLEPFRSLQTSVNGEISSLCASGRDIMLKELEAVSANAKKLHSVIQGEGSVEAEAVEKATLDLTKDAEKLSGGLDVLSKEVDAFFEIILTGRDALLCNLRGSETVPDLLESLREEHAIR